MSTCLPPAPEVVLDTNVWLDLLVFRDPACQGLMNAIERGEVEPISSAECQAEWWRVLRYPALDLSQAAQEQARLLQDGLVKLVEPEPNAELARKPPRCRDPDDQKFLALAIQRRAAVLFSRDLALLSLGRRCQREFALEIRSPHGWSRDDLDPGVVDG